MSQRVIDILDLIPPEAVETVDNVGYELLSKHGYNIEGVQTSPEKREALRKELKANGDELTYAGETDPENGKIRVWYRMYRGDKLLAKSRAIECIPMSKEEKDGENRTDKEGSAPSA